MTRLFKITSAAMTERSAVLGGWVIARFSGTEPLLRIFCEMPTAEDAVKVCEIYENWLEL